MVTGMLLLTGLLLAQGADASDLVPLNQRNLQIPIRIQQARRSEIKELLLFTSSDQGKNWQQIASAAPDKDAFTFYAPADGTYWFSVCVVDSKGNRDPVD